MEPKDWVALAGMLAATIISVATLLINRRREVQQQERDDKLRKEQQEREDTLRKEGEVRAAEEERKRHTYSPHIEFEINCIFWGPQGDSIIAEFRLTARNKGLIQQKFKNILIRVLGINSEEDLAYWKDNEPRLAFPVELLDSESILPKDYNYFFVEPGIEQVFTYVTKIPASVSYILAHAKFEYDQYTPHTTERVFAVKSGNS
jgi:hypothetical protein